MAGCAVAGSVVVVPADDTAAKRALGRGHRVDHVTVLTWRATTAGQTRLLQVWVNDLSGVAMGQ